MASLTLTAIDAALTFAENTVNAGPQLIDTDVNFTSLSNDFTGGNLTVSGLLAGDVVALRDQGTGLGEIGVIGGVITFGGTQIGTLAGGMGSPLVVTFNADASTAAVEAVIENLTYANTSDAADPQRMLVLNVTDAYGDDLGIGYQGFTALTGADDPFHGAATGLFSRPALFDFDNDGDLDVVAGQDWGPLRSFRNDGAAGFSEVSGPADPFSNLMIFTAPPNFTDFDGDGDLDLVISTAFAYFASFANDGAGNFTELPYWNDPFAGYSANMFSSMTFTDLDGDATLDLVIFTDPWNMAVSLGDGAGGYVFAPPGNSPLDFLAGLGLGMPAFFDIDGDGAQDVIAGDSNGGLRVFLRQSPGVYLEATGAANPLAGIAVGQNASMSFGDVTGDGLADLVLNDSSGILRIFEYQQIQGVGIDITVTPDNDGQPTGTLPPSVQVVEDTSTPIDLSGMVFADIDNDVLTVALLSNGTFDVPGGRSPAPGVVVTGSSSYLYLTGKAADLNAWLATPGVISFQGAIDVNGPAAAYMLVQVDDGSGQPVTLGRIDVDIQPVQDLPTFVNPTDTITLNENAANAGTLLFPQAVFRAPDAPMAGGELTISGLLAEDSISLRDGGPTGISQLGADVLYGAVVIGQVSGGGSGSAFHVDFTADASAEAVQALLNALVYHNASDMPTPTRDVLVQLSDSNGDSIGSAAPWTFADQGQSGPFAGIYAAMPGPVQMVDYDQDGDLDAILIQANDQLSTYENSGGAFYLSQQRTLTLPAPNGSLQSVALADLDGNGQPYFLTVDPLGALQVFALDSVTGDTVELLGAADPFGGLTDLTGTPGFADFDGDGDLDVALSGRDGRLHAYDNTGAGFVELTGAADPFAGLPAAGFFGAAFGDIDADGDLDIVGVDGSAGLVSFMNNGDGTWATLTGATSPFGNINSVYFVSPTLVDMNGDGLLDLIAPNYFGQIQTFLNNTGRGQTYTIDVIAQNDAPEVTGAPAQLVMREDILSRVDLTSLRFEDPDQDNPRIALTITASDGTLFATPNRGVQVLLTGTTLVLYGAAAQLESYLAVSRVQYLGAANDFGIGAATLTLTTSDGHDQRAGGTITLDITEIADIQTGNGGNDVLWGDAGRDKINGMGGDDLIRGGAGPDILDGSTGFDTLDYTGSSNVSVNLNIGVSGRQYAVGGDGTGDFILGFEGVIGSDFNDRLVGDAGSNGLYGGAGNDVIMGGAGADTLSGGADRDLLSYSDSAAAVVVSLRTQVSGFQTARGGDAQGDIISGFEAVTGSQYGDTLTGDALRNTLNGKDGADRIAGGGDRDVLIGGGGRDVFVFDTGLGVDNVDTITDFLVGTDRILLDGAVFFGLATGALADAALRVNATGLAEDGSDRVIYNTGTGALSFDIDGLGGRSAVRFAVLDAGLLIDQTSFIIH